MTHSTKEDQDELNRLIQQAKADPGKYEGERNENGFREGYGVNVWRSGKRYEGQWLDD